MEALNSLYEDHRLILRVLDALEAYAKRLGRDDQADRQALRRFHSFFEAFVGLNHHDKEESVLMPALERHGFHWDNGTLEHFRKEHDHEAYLLRALGQACAQETPWSDYDVRSLSDLLKQIMDFSRSHIKHENVNMLLTAVHRLSPDTLRQIDHDLAQFVDEVITQDVHRQLVALGEQLIRHHLPSDAAMPKTG